MTFSETETIKSSAGLMSYSIYTRLLFPVDVLYLTTAYTRLDTLHGSFELLLHQRYLIAVSLEFSSEIYLKS